MDNRNKYIESQKVNHQIQNKKRGEILYYSIDQVADLLNENIDNIKYYTNIFDDLLKIEIVNKDLRYTNSDVDKLEFLIKLKNKGMTLKEIQDYYNKLPINDAQIEYPESNLLSVDELIDLMKKEQQLQFNNFKVELINYIQNTNSLYLENISSTIIEVQSKSLNEFKQNLFKEIKEYIDSKFDSINETNITLHDKLIANATELISEKVDKRNDELKYSLENDFNTFTESTLINNERLLKEVKDFKRVMHDAYTIQYEIEMNNVKTGFWDNLLQIIKLK